MIADILTAVVRANIAGAAGVLVALALRRPARVLFGAGAAYALWGLPVAAALAALLPRTALPTPIDAMVLDLARASAGAAQRSAHTGWPLALLGAWMLGAAATALVLLGRQAKFVGSLGRLTPLREIAGGYRSARAGVGPAVVGVLRPRIVTPSDFDTRFSDDERALILAHERTHLRRGDPCANAVACLAQCLAWFNPLVHLAARLMRIDQELACDADVLRARPQARRRYAEVLLKTQLTATALPLGCHWPSASQHPLKLRIATLAAPAPGLHRRAIGAAAIAVLLVSGGFAAWAAQPTAPAKRMVATPDWLDKPSGRDVASFYPKDAERRRLPGEATISCHVQPSGRLQACRVLKEAPLGAGFGDAAVAMSVRFQMKPLDESGVPTANAWVNIPIRFRVGPKSKAS